MDLYYPMPSEHTETCFILCRTNHILSCAVLTHKTIKNINVQLSFLEINDYRFWLTITLTPTKP